MTYKRAGTSDTRMPYTAATDKIQNTEKIFTKIQNIFGINKQALFLKFTSMRTSSSQKNKTQHQFLPYNFLLQCKFIVKVIIHSIYFCNFELGEHYSACLNIIIGYHKFNTLYYYIPYCQVNILIIEITLNNR